MSLSAVIQALALPPTSLVDKRVPKKLLLEQGAPTSADRRQIRDAVDEMVWVAALKPTNVAVPSFRDEAREYLEVAVLTVALRAAAKPPRLIELIHRAIPYPVMLVAAHGDTVTLSLAHKRWSQGETGKVVAEEIVCTAPFRPEAPTAEEARFLTSLAVTILPRLDLYTLYQAWMDRVAALAAAKITGSFSPPGTTERASALRQGLEVHARLQREIVTLRSQAAREKQVSRRVDLNLEIKRLEAKLTAAARKVAATSGNGEPEAQ